MSAALGDRLNAIFVKEVRQALRGRFFATVYVGTSALIGVACSIAIVLTGRFDESSASVGFEVGGWPVLLTAMGCAGLGAVAFVPFGAFQSLAAESEENTLEMLQLSGLTPARIVFGKLFGNVLQALLILLTALPFAMLAFLLRGVGLGAIAWGFATTLVASLTMSSVGLGCAAVSRVRWIRIVMMVVFLLFLFQIGSYALVLILPIAFGSLVGGPGLGWIAGSMVVSFSLFASLALIFACARLTHPEQNPSGPARVFSMAITAAIAGGALPLIAAGTPPEIVHGFLVTVLVLVGVVALFLCTEPERLGRGARARIATNPGLALLVAPFLSGGGRGALLLLVQLVFLAVAAVVASSLSGAPDEAAAFVVGCAYVAVYVLLPSGIAALLSASTWVRWGARIAIAILPLAAYLVPMLAAMVLAPGDFGRVTQHAGNLGHTLRTVSQSGLAGARPELTILAAALLVALLVNVPRLVRGAAEVLRAARARRVTIAVPAAEPIAEEHARAQP